MNRKEFINKGLSILGFIGIGSFLGVFSPSLRNLFGVAKGRYQLGFFVDMEKCVGCRACEAACKQYYNLSTDVRWRKVRAREGGEFPDSGRVFMSLACNHCERPACEKVCPVGAYHKRRKDGIVLHDKDKCIGCKYCTWACPYQVPQFEKTAKKVHKCELCVTRLDRSQRPMCVSVCPTGALDYGNVDKFSRIHEEVLREVPGFPDIAITSPTTRFRLPKKQYSHTKRIIDKDVDKREQPI